MNNDLISREALKKEIERTFDMQDLYLPVHFLDLIDNAPTVTPQAFYNGIVEIISKNGITTVDELLETLKGGKENG